MTPLSLLPRRNLENQREAIARQAHDVRKRADTLLDLDDRLRVTAHNLEVREAGISEREHRLRQLETTLGDREAALQRREREQDRRESVSLQEHVAETLKAGRAVLFDGDGITEGAALDQPFTAAHRQMADQIIRAGQLRRGEVTNESSLPTDKTARAIVLAGMQARGEICSDEPPPGATGDDDLTAQRRATAAAIVKAGKRRRAEIT